MDEADCQEVSDLELPEGLSPRQQEAIAALLREPSITRAAAAVNVSERTLYRWLEDPSFADAYRRNRRHAFGQSIALTQRYAVFAVDALVRILSDANASANARVSAAATLLRFGREGIELDDLAARLDAIEAALVPAERRPRGAPLR